MYSMTHSRRSSHFLQSILRTSAFAACLLATTSMASAEKLKIVFATQSATSNTFWQAVKKGFDDACARIDADCKMVFTQNEGSVEQQIANLQAALSAKPDGIITSIVDNKAYDKVMADARAAGIVALASNVDDTEGAKGNARQAFIGQGFVPAGYSLGKAIAEDFPKDGPIKVLLGVSAPGQNWSESRAAGIIKYLEEYKAANPSRQVSWERIDSGMDLAVTSDRVGAYLNAHPDTTAYFDTGFWCAGVARVLAERGVAPGKVSLGGFDLVPEVLQQMKKGYVQALVDQQPYMQGFMPVMEVYLSKTFGLAPVDIDTGQAIIRKDQVDAIMTLSAKGLR